MPHKRSAAVLCRLSIGYLAIGVAMVAYVVPAAFARDQQVLVHGTSAPTGNESDEPQTHQDVSDGQSSKTWEHMGAYVAKPIGRFWVGPEFVEGETVYLNRTPVTPRTAIVEVSSTPYMNELTGVYELSGKADEQPAGW